MLNSQVRNMTFSQIFSLASVLGGGVVAAFVVSYLAGRRDLKDYKRKKHEELYEIIREDEIKFFDWWIRYQAAFEGSVALEVAKQGRTSTVGGAERKTKADMLANLYAPKIINPLKEYWRAKQSLVLLIDDMEKERKNAKLVHMPMDSFNEARAKVDEARQQLFAAIAVQSGKL